MNVSGNSSKGATNEDLVDAASVRAREAVNDVLQGAPQGTVDGVLVFVLSRAGGAAHFAYRNCPRAQRIIKRMARALEDAGREIGEVQQTTVPVETPVPGRN